MTAPLSSSHLNEIYGLMCRAGLNKEYYGTMLHRYHTINVWTDLVIAAGTAGSGVSVLTIWELPYGKVVLGALSLMATLLALAKPIFQVGRKIERLSKLFAGHSDNYTQLFMLMSRIRRRGEISANDLAAFEIAEARFHELSMDDDPRPNHFVLSICDERIRQRYPAEDFLINFTGPAEQPGQAAKTAEA